MIEVQLTCRGGEWGGPTVRGIHSYNSAWIANPVWRLVSALSTMCDKNERITIDGFLDQVREPSEEDRGLCKRLAESGFLEHMLSTNDTLRFKWDVPPEEVCLRAYTQPQINISGIWGGYTGPGSKTLLPHEVTVRMDIRTVPDMDADVAERLIRKHLDSCGYADIETQFSIGSPWSKVDISAPIVQAVLTAYRNMGVEPAFMPNSLGGEPNYLWSRVLGIPYMRGGMGHGARSHSSNEYCTVAGLLSMEKFVVHVLDNYVKLALI
jgi:acetylornithine deacetylase/succinyl-diaminopimelate desuccinylase-like protein